MNKRRSTTSNSPPPRPLSRTSELVEQLIDAGFVAPAAHDLIDQLYLKGYLDEGNDEIRLIHDD
jgi:hypothetical protein